jgi:hypothetical protein
MRLLGIQVVQRAVGGYVLTNNLQQQEQQQQHEIQFVNMLDPRNICDVWVAQSYA